MTRNNKHIKGDQAELIAQEFFIKKGFYVFNNISQHGPADMCVLDHATRKCRYKKNNVINKKEYMEIFTPE